MTKTELIDAVATTTGLTKVKAGQVIDLTIDEIEQALVRGEMVQVIGFGSFEVRERPARVGRNPQTGEAIQIAAHKVPLFRAGKTLKERVSGTTK